MLKSRGLAHSNQVREFVISDSGLDLRDVYTGLEGIALGSARVAAEAHGRNEDAPREEERDRRQRAVEVKRATLEAQIAAMRAELDYEIAEVRRAGRDEDARADRALEDQAVMAAARRADRPSGRAARGLSSDGRKGG